MDAFLAAWDRLPRGNFDGLYKGRRYAVTRTERAGGRQGWIWAEELGGRGRISANLYRLASGPQLNPCEMPHETVIDFVTKVRVIDKV
ncbi:MAG: hypothetical protein AAF311_03300 [Pseudomonadota bacterium]